MFRPMLIWREMSDAYQTLEDQLGVTGVVLSMPWNAHSWVSRVMAKVHYLGCLAGSDRVEYNNVATLDRFWLKGWTPNFNGIGAANLIDQVTKAITEIPLGGWLIIQLHNVGTEGYGPIAVRQFYDICDFVARREDVSVVTVRAGIQRASELSTGLVSAFPIRTNGTK